MTSEEPEADKNRPGWWARRRAFGERRAVVRRKRSATWRVVVALIVATVGAAALGYLGVQLFYLPETLAEQQLNRVPDLAGMRPADAQRKAGAQGYEVLVGARLPSDELEAGRIVYQLPPPETYRPRGDTLWVLVSSGKADTRLPDLAGLAPEQAVAILTQLGADTTPRRLERSDLQPLGTVTGTVPPAGSEVEDGARVTLVISAGGTLVEMPDVVGLSLAASRDTLEAHGLTVGAVTGVGRQAVGEGEVTVAGQVPAVGQRVRAGSAVRLRLGEAARRSPTAPRGAPAGTPAAPPDEDGAF